MRRRLHRWPIRRDGGDSAVGDVSGAEVLAGGEQVRPGWEVRARGGFQGEGAEVDVVVAVGAGVGGQCGAADANVIGEGGLATLGPSAARRVGADVAFEDGGSRDASRISDEADFARPSGANEVGSETVPGPAEIAVGWGVSPVQPVKEGSAELPGAIEMASASTSETPISGRGGSHSGASRRSRRHQSRRGAGWSSWGRGCVGRSTSRKRRCRGRGRVRGWRFGVAVGQAQQGAEPARSEVGK